MCDRDESHVALEFITKGRLNDRICLIICSSVVSQTTLREKKYERYYQWRMLLCKRCTRLALEIILPTKGEKVTFIKDEQLASADDRAGQRQDLSLTDGKVTTAARDLAF